eukprot:gene2637-3834_t
MPKKKEKTKSPKKPTKQKRKIDEIEDKPTSKAKKTKGTVENSLENLSSSLNSLVESQSNDTVEEDFKTILNEEYLEETSTIPLIRKLKKVYAALSKISQDEYNPKLWHKRFPKLFIGKKYINHKDKEVKLLTGCILCEFFRITVPEHPFDVDEVKKIFNLFVSQLKGLEDIESPLFSTYFKLLEKIASIRIFVLLSDTDTYGSSLIEKSFSTFFEIINSKHEQKVSVYMIDIMVSLIESCETISTTLLETILEPLISKEEETESSYHLSKVLLSRSVDYIVTNLTEYIVQELNNLDKTKPKFKVKRGHIFKILIQLNDISSKLLLYIMPTIASQLKDEDVQIRSAIILLLSKMFSSKESTLIQDYNEIFNEFLGRFNDVDSNIRIHMVKSMIDILKNHSNQNLDLDKINKYLLDRIMDQDEKVRRNVVESVIEIEIYSNSLISIDLLKQVGERTRDKKDQLRIHTTKLLIKLYKTYSNLIGSNQKRYEWIPEKVIINSTNLDQINSILIEELLNIEKEEEEEDSKNRMKSFLNFYSLLKENGRMIFINFLKSKERYFESIKLYFENEKSIENVLPLNDIKIWNSLSKENLKKIKDGLFKDELNFKNLKKIKKIINQSKDDDLKLIFLKLEPLFTIDQMDELFDLIIKDENELELLSCLSEILNSNIFVNSYKKLISILLKKEEEEKNESLILTILKVLKNIGMGNETSNSNLIKRLKKLIESKNEKFIKYSIRCCFKLLKEFDKFISKIYNDLILDLEFNDDLLFSLVALREISLLSPSIFKSKAIILSNFIKDDLIKNEDLKKTTSSSLENVSYECKVKCQGIKVLIGYLICLEKEGISYSSEETKKDLIEFLFELLNELKDSNNIEDLRLLLKVSNGLLEISTISEYHKTLLGRKEFLDLSFISLNEIIGKLFLEKLFEKLKKMKLPLKYISILLLGISDGDSKIKNYIQIILQNLKQHNDFKKIHLSSDDSFKYCPEYILPSLIYILSHYPNYNIEKENFNHFQKILFTYFDLVTQNVDNLSFFQQLISKLKQRKDIDLKNDNDDSFRIQELCDLTLSILNRSTEGKSHSSQVYPGKIYIPPYYKLAEGFKVTQLFLSPSIKISEKNARKLTNSTPEKKHSTPTKKGNVSKLKSPKSKTPAKSPKSKTPKKSPKKKIENVESRTKLKRGAKKVSNYEEEEESIQSDEDQMSEEEEIIEEPKKSLTKKRKRKI